MSQPAHSATAWIWVLALILSACGNDNGNKQENPVEPATPSSPQPSQEAAGPPPPLVPAAPPTPAPIEKRPSEMKRPPAPVVKDTGPPPLLIPAAPLTPVPVEERLDEVKRRVIPVLKEQLAAAGLELGDPVFLRVFKETYELELWMKPKSATAYQKWKTWPIAAMSGKLGPKLKQGDRQAPEGFYEVSARALNPRSTYHLSFNIGYPNAFDQAHQRTGNFIMVHGNAVSIGCFAMTDPVIEVLYLIGEAALKKGQPTFPVHVFPFRMTEERMIKAADEHPEWLPFWTDLQKGYEAFETVSLPPKITISEKRYVVQPATLRHRS